MEMFDQFCLLNIERFRLMSRVVILQVNLRADIGEVFKIRVGLAELPDTAQYWTLESVRPCIVSQCCF